MTERGGPQLIPRPDGAMVGRPAPWAELNETDRRIDIGSIRSVLEARGEGQVVGSYREERESAVLVPLYESGGEAWVVLTRRASHMRSHRHEVSFPGGVREPVDLTLLDTALREANEEIDLDPALVHPVGELDRFVTVGSRTLVHPFVSVLPAGRPALTPDPSEVEHVLHVPLAELIRDDVYREERWPLAGSWRAITFFELDGDTVWGATAAMLRQLLALATGTDASLIRP